jgi:ankyrin repeat protein
VGHGPYAKVLTPKDKKKERNSPCKVVQWLHGQGVPLTATNGNGSQLIHIAARYGHLAMVQWLHEQGVPLTATDGNGDQPIHLAARFGHLAVVRGWPASDHS